MTLGRLATATVIAALLVGSACAGQNAGGADGISGGNSLGGSSNQAPGRGVASGPPVINAASVDISVAQDAINSAARRVVHIATAPRVGGFLVSSVVDLDDGYGYGDVSVKVPTLRFEGVVSDLQTIGDVRRQELRGGHLSIGPEARTTYSAVHVALLGKQPPAAPEKPAYERAVLTAKTITLNILSAIVLGAGVIVPIGLLGVVLYLVGAPIRRRLRPRMES